MRVIIAHYDPIKGKGLFTASGTDQPFTYHQFDQQKMIPVGSQAEYINDTLYPVPETLMSKLILKAKEVLKWR